MPRLLDRLREAACADAADRIADEMQARQDSARSASSGAAAARQSSRELLESSQRLAELVGSFRT